MPSIMRVKQAPRIIKIGDDHVQVLERQTNLPPRLDALLAEARIFSRTPVRVLGNRQDCVDAEHDWHKWLRGYFRGMEVTLRRCTFCGSVEVRDVSFDILPGLAVGERGPERKSDVLGWYSGKRPAGREYL